MTTRSFFGDLSGETVALKVGADPETVFKTLVCIGDKTGPIVFCIPVTKELNLKKILNDLILLLVLIFNSISMSMSVNSSQSLLSVSPSAHRQKAFSPLQ